MISLQDNSKANEETVRLYQKYYDHRHVVGLDLAGFEDSVPMEHYRYLFEEPKRLHLPMTIHAGDNGIPENCSTVIDFGASRIGHGHHCYYNKDVMQEVIDKKVALEICLTSNIQCKTEPSYQLHPAKKLLDAGALVTLNTDLFNGNTQHPVFDTVANIFIDLFCNLQETGFQYDYQYDQTVSFGEVLSTTIISAFLNDNGIKNTLLDARDYIITDHNFRSANIDWDESRLRIQKLNNEHNGELLITQGFIASSTKPVVTTTLGRELTPNRFRSFTPVPCGTVVLCGISTRFQVLSPTLRQIVHALLTRLPLS